MINSSDPELERRLLELVQSEGYRPVKPKYLAQQLDLPDDRLRELKKLIKLLIKTGKLQYGSHHLVMPGAAPKVDPFLLEGRFKRTSRGFGFVIPDGATPGDRRDDVFIREEDTRDAATGDRVAVKLRRGRGPYGKRSGFIVEVVHRKTNRFVGTFRLEAEVGVVDVDGGQFDEPVVVSDAATKDCRAGDKVVVELIRFPTHVVEGEGVIVEVLGKRTKPGVDTMIVMREFNLPEDFPEAVLDEARREAESFSDEIPDNRADLTGETVITIDPVDARDFDDAISLLRLDNGHWQLSVHIADVAHFVRPNSALDNVAYARATSVYLPDRVVPMLPELISNGLASLQPDRVRFARTARIEFTKEGVPIGADVFRSAIKSCRRFTYEEVDEFIADPAAWKEELTPSVHVLLSEMHELAMMLRRRRLELGAIELGLPEVKIDMNADGQVTGAHSVEHTESHQVIEEFMLAANVAVATKLADQELFLLRRIHPQPATRKLKELTRFVHGLGVESASLQSRFEIKRVLAEIAGEQLEYAVNLAVLKSMQKAVYSPREEGHYALNAEHYCHFTSPIRRYPDLVVHRMMDALEDGYRPASEYKHLERLGHHCSEQEQNAERAERELIKLKLINFFADRLGSEMDAMITGVEPYGLFAQGVEIPAEGLITLSDLGHDLYDYDGETQSLTGRRSGHIYRLGDSIRVRIAVADPDRRMIEMVAVEGNARGGRPSRGLKRNRDGSKQKRVGKPKANEKPKHGKDKAGAFIGKRTKKKKAKRKNSKPRQRKVN